MSELQVLVLNGIWAISGLGFGWFLRAMKAEREEDKQWWAEHDRWWAEYQEQEKSRGTK